MKLFDDALGIHPQALMLRAQRAEVLAANLANSDTPGFKARDFDFKSVLRQEMGEPVRLRTTRTQHIQTEADLIPPSQLSYRLPMQPSLDGNTVDSQQEYSAFAANSLEYQASLRFLDGKIKGLLLAIKGQ